MHWANSVGPDVLVEIRRTSTVRDVREGMLALAYAIEVSGSLQPPDGLCIVLDTRLSSERLAKELGRFRAIVRPDVARHIHLATVFSGPVLSFDGDLPTQDPGFLGALEAAIQREKAPSASGRVTRQQVKAMLVERWLCSLPGLTMADVRRQSGASYQTISAALHELEQLHVVGSDREGPITISGMTATLLLRLASEHVAARKTVRFVDPSGLAKLPSAMAHKLEKLRVKGSAGQLAVGGVLGALHYFEELNITAAPRLDLSVYDGDVRFVRQLDAGVMEAPKVRTLHKTVLALHLQRDCRPAEVSRRGGCAARLDCLADLLEIGLQGEAAEFAEELCDLARRAA